MIFPCSGLLLVLEPSLVVCLLVYLSDAGGYAGRTRHSSGNTIKKKRRHQMCPEPVPVPGFRPEAPGQEKPSLFLTHHTKKRIGLSPGPLIVITNPIQYFLFNFARLRCTSTSGEQ